ncbi:MAG: TrkA C-terminal domain-containing protein [Christensenellaceae bacterium]
MKIPVGSIMAGKKLSEINTGKKRFSILIAAVERDGNIVVPNGDTVLKEGDVLRSAPNISSCATFFAATVCSRKKYSM